MVHGTGVWPLLKLGAGHIDKGACCARAHDMGLAAYYDPISPFAKLSVGSQAPSHLGCRQTNSLGQRVCGHGGHHIV